MNATARAICIAAVAFLSCNCMCNAAEEPPPHAKLLIDYPGMIRCYEDGRVEFQAWKTLPWEKGLFPPMELVVASTAQLPPEQLSRLVALVDEYLTHPAPFIYANFAVTDQHFTIVEVRHGQKIRLTCVRFVPIPAALEDFLRTISEPLASAKIESGDTKRRDEILAEFKSKEPSPEMAFRTRLRGLVTIANDDPEKLVDQLFETTALGRSKSNVNQCLIFVAALEGTALGDKIYANIQKHRDNLSAGDQIQLLDTALHGGSLKPLPEFPKLLHNLMNDNVAAFPDALLQTIEEILGEEDLKKLARRIGVDKITPARSLKAWDWLTANTGQLKFDQVTHQFHVVDPR